MFKMRLISILIKVGIPSFKLPPAIDQRTPFHYFKIMFPMDDANDWIVKTNSSLSKLNRRSLTKCEYFRFWGLILAISIGSEPNRRNYWVEESETDSKQLFPPHSFGS